MGREAETSRCAIVGALAAGLGWVVAEVLARWLWPQGGWLAAPATCGLIALSVGLSLDLANRDREPRPRRLRQLLLVGSAGLVSGALGGSVSNLGAAWLGSRVPGWMVWGMGIGVVDGLATRSAFRLRLGLTAGLAGGLVGGLLFGPVATVVGWLSSAAGRLLAFVLLAACVGAGLGLTRDLFLRAWLSVVRRDRPGREVILSDRPCTIGRDERATLPLADPSQRQVEPEHARVSRRADGRFVLEDGRGAQGTRVNQARIVGRAELNDGDLIQVGPHAVRFRQRRGGLDWKVGWTRPSKPAEGPIPTQRNPGPATPPPQAARAIEQPAAPSPAPAPAQTKSLGPTPRGMTRCPTCGRLLTASRPTCARCGGSA